MEGKSITKPNYCLLTLLCTCLLSCLLFSCSFQVALADDSDIIWDNAFYNYALYYANGGGYVDTMPMAAGVTLGNSTGSYSMASAELGIPFLHNNSLYCDTNYPFLFQGMYNNTSVVLDKTGTYGGMGFVIEMMIPVSDVPLGNYTFDLSYFTMPRSPSTYNPGYTSAYYHYFDVGVCNLTDDGYADMSDWMSLYSTNFIYNGTSVTEGSFTPSFVIPVTTKSYICFRYVVSSKIYSKIVYPNSSLVADTYKLLIFKSYTQEGHGSVTIPDSEPPVAPESPETEAPITPEETKGFWGNIIDAVTSLPSLILDGIYHLFVPDDFSGLIQEQSSKLTSSLGLLWFPIETVTDTYSAIASTPDNWILTLPAFTIPILNVQLWSEYSFDMDAFLLNLGLSDIVHTFASFTLLLATLAYVKGTLDLILFDGKPYDLEGDSL